MKSPQFLKSKVDLVAVALALVTGLALGYLGGAVVHEVKVHRAFVNTMDDLKVAMKQTQEAKHFGQREFDWTMGFVSGVNAIREKL